MNWRKKKMGQTNSRHTLDFCLLVGCDMKLYDEIQILEETQETDFKLDKCAYLNVRCWQRQGAKLQGQCIDSRDYTLAAS